MRERSLIYREIARRVTPKYVTFIDGSQMSAADFELFALGDHPLQSGEVLRDAQLAYATYGTLNRERTNVVVFPTAYAGTHADNEWLIAAGRALDPARWFVVCPNLFGGGLSSSPSTMRGAQAGPRFPSVTIYDNVSAQYRLVSDVFGARRVALAIGFSMGAQQAYHWACAHPGFVERIAPICGSARTAQHNIVFLDGIRATLTADPAFADGAYATPPVTGLRAVGSVWAGWGRSQAFYREEAWRAEGFSSRDDFVRTNYIEAFAQADANDLLAMLRTWREADISRDPRFGGDFARALGAIEARAVVMPSTTDLYFPPEDSALEVRGLPRAELAPIASILGHAAGGGGHAVEDAFIDARVARLLATACA
jgi:homoserine O-acetyltransferase